MSNVISALSGEYLDSRTFRYARNQRDAGIEHLPWETRLPPMRPLVTDVAIGVAVVIAAVAAILLG
ncbi:MAG TPA: hypothetical protein VMH86_01430 [Rhizomicrobium sp.]|nr:hypothetical protein [Rhizomicrobium sp.]